MYHVTGELTRFKSVAQLAFVRLHPQVPQQVRSRWCHQQALLTTQSLEGWGGGWEKHRCTLLPPSPPSVPFPSSQSSEHLLLL